MDVLAAQRLTLDEYLALPEQPARIELVEGRVVVTPAPSLRHQVTVTRLARVLADAASDDLEVIVSPVDWVVDASEPATVRQPDLVVVRRPYHGDRLTEPPLVAVEVLSPGSREVDLVTKRRTYAAAGARYYWLVDPDVAAVRVERNVDGKFVEVASATGDEELVVADPFAVRLRPSQLAD